MSLVNKLAIVIPYFKYDKFEETLSSLNKQTNQNFNVYIGDDASSHSPESLINKFDFTNRLFYKKFNENIGKKSLTSQWERCVKLVSGRETWIMILCDDDVLSENCVSEFYFNINKVNKLGSNVIRFASRVINGDGVYISEKYIHPEIENPLDFIFRKEQGGTRSSLSEYIFRRDILQNKGFVKLDLGWYSDLLAVLEYSVNKYIYSINNAIVFFRIYQNSITGNPHFQKTKHSSLLKYYYLLLLKYSRLIDDKSFNILKKRFFKIFNENKKNIYSWYLFIKLSIIIFSRFWQNKAPKFKFEP